MKRALLIWNPAASSTTPAMCDVIARALGSDLHVEVAATESRNHATEIASAAAMRGDADLVCVLGGDGTVNEVLNGLSGSGMPLATIPGGGTNVLARTLGFPNDPVEATSILLGKIRAESVRTIPLGRVNGRAFAFCAGAGFDAAVVRDVEANPLGRRWLGESFFVLSAFKRWMVAGLRKSERMTLEWEGGRFDDVRILIVGNSDPYTFFGPRPFRVVPHASLDEPSLDATIMRTFNVVKMLRVIGSAFTTGRHHNSMRGLSSFTVGSDEPIPYHVDGDIVGESTELRFWIDPGAARVIA